jgi:hypothetical protein
LINRINDIKNKKSQFKINKIRSEINTYNDENKTKTKVKDVLKHKYDNVKHIREITRDRVKHDRLALGGYFKEVFMTENLGN